jgi:hypothetical protein
MMVEIFGSRILSQIIWTEAALVMAMARLYEREIRVGNAAVETVPVSDPSDVITLLPERKRV